MYKLSLETVDTRNVFKKTLAESGAEKSHVYN
jgi:hypothetical protein